jgi:hypothetical protein
MFQRDDAPVSGVRGDGAALITRGTETEVAAAPEPMRVALQLAPLVVAVTAGAATNLVPFVAWIDARTEGALTTLFPEGGRAAAMQMRAMIETGLPGERLLGASLAALAFVAPEARRIYAGEIRELAHHVLGSNRRRWLSFVPSEPGPEEREALDEIELVLARIAGA